MIAREDHLFGLLAVQSGLVDAVAFLDAWNSLDGSERLPDVLVRRGLILAEDREHLAYLVRRKLPAVESTPSSTATVPFTPIPARYHYVDRCGFGGMGDVWRAHDTHLNRDVAIKTLKHEHATNDQIRSRFLREARITSQLDHPGIVPVYDLLPDEDGRPRYAMRILSGRTLGQAIRQMHDRKTSGEDISLERAELLQAFVAICNTVGYAHSRGVLHRDLKPANVQLGDYGEVVVLDWGLASRSTIDPASSNDDGMTRHGSILGTPEYMAPEMADGDSSSVDERSDIYGLGAILYQILTGVPPFRGGSMCETLALVRAGKLTPVRERCPEVSQGLETICHKALSRRPEDRYSLATDLAEAVLHWQESERLEAERALRESEERLRLALEAGKIGVWDWDLPSGRITWSDRVYEIQGLKQGEFGGLHSDFTALIHPDDVDAIAEAHRLAAENREFFEQEFRIVRPGGEIRWVSTSAQVIYDGTDLPVRMLGAVIDVTDRRNAEEALRESEERFRTLIQAVPQSLWIVSPDFRLEYSNNSATSPERRRSHEELKDLNWQAYVHPDDLPGVLRAWGEALSTGNTFEHEYKWQVRDGSYRWNLSRAVPLRDAENRIVKWFGSTTDIHHLKQAIQERDEAIRRVGISEQRYRLLTDLIPQNVWTATPEGGVHYANQRGVNYHGVVPDDGLGDAWQEVVHPDDLSRCLDRWQHSVASGEPYEIEFRLRDSTGEYRWYLARAVAVRDDQGQIVQWFGTNTDIDRLKQAEMERDEALRCLRSQ